MNKDTVEAAGQQAPPKGVSAEAFRRLVQLVELEKRVRQATHEAEIGFIISNETHSLVPYRQAILWQPTHQEKGKIVAVSGLVAPDHNAPFIVWMHKVFSYLNKSEGLKIQAVGRDNLPEELQQEWTTWFPSHGLIVPLKIQQGTLVGLLLLVRDIPWSDSECTLLTMLSDAYAHAWHALLAKPSLLSKLLFNRNKMAIIAVVILILLCFFPLRQSAIAPAEVIARNPHIVRSGVEGVIKEFRVQPNQVVKKGQPLLLLDDARIANQLEIAMKAMETAESEYRQASQQAVFDSQTKLSLASLRGQVEQHSAEVDYYKALKERIVIRAPRDGIAVFNDVNDWIGRPVALGERILMVADPLDVELEIQLPVADAIYLQEGNDVRLFLNVSAHKSVLAQLRFISYQADTNQAGVFAYRLVANFSEIDNLPRIGLKGSAKLYGEPTTLAAYLFRRPYFAVRQYLGL
ncbi:HlyD family efflux transporter periplasmic adaptor subunit [Amphritea sp. 1_MG-2023]|uniref:efflux RND transporter periplasmic adaptor subunit n=1 Tax=Amphritea sp. 1_MG-2023 TaxID=3062670 RepID=UPI0026E21813|nr:HlyD family efflux transporter periplasmic adaptor subunit [Amphritea sp. 1_MG-2023]MDO6564936.1 HlyD family efflux transporter periplasmic adaptor subunit [Amphritea sp. 1_MG-2023]